MSPIAEDRLAAVQTLVLESGAHHEPNGTMKACVMEAVAYIAGEAWSDHPGCACPIISAFMRSWNDGLNKEDRNRLLKPLIPRLVDTKRDTETERRRTVMCADWYIRSFTPAWLRLAKLDRQAELLEMLPEITDMAKVPPILPTLEAIQSDASAAWSAAWSAARSAAESAAESAARSAARSAAERMLAA